MPIDCDVHSMGNFVYFLYFVHFLFYVFVSGPKSHVISSFFRQITYQESHLLEDLLEGFLHLVPDVPLLGVCSLPF